MHPGLGHHGHLAHTVISLIQTLVHINNLDTIANKLIFKHIGYLAIALHHEICLGVAAVEHYSFRLAQTASAAALAAAEGVVPEEQDGENDAEDMWGNPKDKLYDNLWA